MSVGASRNDLEIEASAIGRYLVSRPLPQGLVSRYIQVNEELFEEAPSGRDLEIMQFIRDRAWALPGLDAVTAILRPDCVLRRKILVLSAILETSPEFADEFLPRQLPLWALFPRTAVLGLTAIWRFVVGVLLYPLVTRART